jgi:hypothetical protein
MNSEIETAINNNANQRSTAPPGSSTTKFPRSYGWHSCPRLGGQQERREPHDRSDSGTCGTRWPDGAASTCQSQIRWRCPRSTDLALASVVVGSPFDLSGRQRGAVAATAQRLDLTHPSTHNGTIRSLRTTDPSFDTKKDEFERLASLTSHAESKRGFDVTLLRSGTFRSLDRLWC